MIKIIILLIVFCVRIFPGEIDSREVHVQNNQKESFKKTQYIMKKMNLLLKNKHLDALKTASDEEVKLFCTKHNINLEDVKYVIDR